MVDGKQQLAYWIQEREAIRLKKEAGLPKPWSDDPVFQSVYFCNVHREDDKVTKWIRQNWTYGENYEFAMCLARLINNPETLNTLGYPKVWSPGEFTLRCRLRVALGARVWGNAYVVTTHGIPGSKIDYAARILDAAHSYLDTHPLGRTLASAHKVLSYLEGFGSFMAAQVVADLKNTEGHPLEDAPDWFDWSAPGPGSLRGLSWYYDRKVTERTYQKDICQARLEVWPLIDESICMQDFQNCLCEFDKYMRVKTSVGRSKRRYNGT